MRDLALPHQEIIQMSEPTLGAMPIPALMKRIRDIRAYIGDKKDTWAKQGWPIEAIPESEKAEIAHAEEIGIRLFDAIRLPLSYRRNSRLELSATLRTIEKDSSLQGASNNWQYMTGEEQLSILQKISANFAARQGNHIPQIEVIAAPLQWVNQRPFEANTSADYHQDPQQYFIQLNADADLEFQKDFFMAAKCVLHEQTHIKQTIYAHAYLTGQLPDEFSRVAIYMMEQRDSYIPAWRSQRLWAAQPCEREAMLATNSTLSFK